MVAKLEDLSVVSIWWQYYLLVFCWHSLLLIELHTFFKLYNRITIITSNISLCLKCYVNSYHLAEFCLQLGLLLNKALQCYLCTYLALSLALSLLVVYTWVQIILADDIPICWVTRFGYISCQQSFSLFSFIHMAQMQFLSMLPYSYYGCLQSLMLRLVTVLIPACLKTFVRNVVLSY